MSRTAFPYGQPYSADYSTMPGGIAEIFSRGAARSENNLKIDIGQGDGFFVIIAAWQREL
ncbi:MAG: hypothetical protein L7F77_09525 [Candidatus Magnetominusculus sp. LBB02]|nr:hypothetical protein [Candidatus Magnetominusculus sp. LBB02]